MTREELMQALTDLGTMDDGAERRNHLTAISDEVKAIFDSNETLTASNNKLGEDNKKLQEYNMQLFLRVGGQEKKPEEQKPPEDNLKYDDLFNEKGDLK